MANIASEYVCDGVDFSLTSICKAVVRMSEHYSLKSVYILLVFFIYSQRHARYRYVCMFLQDYSRLGHRSLDLGLLSLYAYTELGSFCLLTADAMTLANVTLVKPIRGMLRNYTVCGRYLPGK